MSTYGYLAHHGIQGQKWGVRRYQNADGSLTAAGYRRYYGNMKDMSREERKQWKTAMDIDRSKWSKDAKAAYKAAKAKVRSGELSKESKEFQKAKDDRTMAGAKASNLAAYRFGTAEEKAEALKSRKRGKARTTAALATTGAVTLAGVAATGVATIAVADALAKLSLGTAAVTGASIGTMGVAATSKGFGNNLKRSVDQYKNVETSYDGSETYRGTGANRRVSVNMPKIKKDTRGNIIDKDAQKDSFFKALDSEINRFIKDKWAHSGPGAVSDVAQYDYIKDNHMKRTDSLIDGLKEMGESQEEIDNRISNILNNSHYLDDSDKTIEYDYHNRHK
ncbi:MAG: hypothetical protein J6Y02_05635 [Pseudobutyrivibrio sp.]|nr:hypothetical protein [Pseudobutyrivibrio sp.]